MERNIPFVHLHLHTDGSLLDGVGSPKRYAEKAKEFGHPAVAITDHGSAIQTLNFWKACKAVGVKPITGSEFYVTTDLDVKLPNRQRELIARDKHLIILAKNDIGYKNLCKLNYLSYTDGYYYKPRITFDMLFEHKEGLIISSACAGGMHAQLVNDEQYELAEEWLLKFKKEFGEDFYVEVQINGIDNKEEFGINQKKINADLIKLARKNNIEIIMTSDVHYVEKEDVKLQDILINCMQRKDGPATETGQSFMHARELYFHNSENIFEMNERYNYGYTEEEITEWLGNTIKIADKCNFDFVIGENNYPKYTLPKGADIVKYSKKLAYDGLMKKLQARIEEGEEFSDELIETYEKRIETEVQVIADKGYLDYFLVWHDLAIFADKSGIQRGPARGSAGGSLFAYGLDITDVDPVKFGLFFERFLNPERTAQPDIDSDFEEGSRALVREYLENTYGKDCVFGVMTATSYHPKSALQDASRGLGKDTSFGSTLMMEVTKFPELEKTEEKLVDFFNEIKDNPNTTVTVLQWINENEDTIYWADKMMGLIKNAGTHAGGIVITPGPIYNYIPVTRGGKEVVTAFKESDGGGHDLSELGILKLDILGLKTLNVIKGCISEIKKNTGEDITAKVKYVNLQDKKIFRKFAKGNNVGIFQMDGSAQNSLIKSIKPDCFEDIVAINAINRPGPLESFSQIYGKWKRWENEKNYEELAKIEEERYPFEFMKEPLKETYGCLLFQEQFMLMVQAAAGFNMGEADSFRRAIGWPKTHPKFHTVQKYFDKMEEGMIAKGYTKSDFGKFLEYCKKFMGYSFNKSHSVAYSYVAMQTLYLKTYYPVYFYSNLLNSEKSENYQSIIADAIANGVSILPPSINKSTFDFKVEGDAIRIGFVALKGFGPKAMEELLELDLSQYNTIYEILNVPFKKVNKTAFQCLIDAGCFDEFGVEREKIEVVKSLYAEKKIATWFTRKSKPLDISNLPEVLFDFPEDKVFSIAQEVKGEPEPWKKFINELIPYIKYKPLTKKQREDRTEAVLGFSMDLVERLGKLITIGEKYPELNLKSLSAHECDEDLVYWYLLNKTTAKTKKGKNYLVLTLTDGNAKISVKCWEMIDINKNQAYVSHLKKDKWGYTLILDDFLVEISLE